MKKVTQKQKNKKNSRKKNSLPKKNTLVKPSGTSPQKKQGKQKPVRDIRKKALEKKGGKDNTFRGRINTAKQFLRESKMELKKVKWPTKKELLAATAVVIFLSLLMALYFGIVDFCLIKIIKVIIR